MFLEPQVQLTAAKLATYLRDLQHLSKVGTSRIGKSNFHLVADLKLSFGQPSRTNCGTEPPSKDHADASPKDMKTKHAG
jgi:hypothetical protein